VIAAGLVFGVAVPGMSGTLAEGLVTTRSQRCGDTAALVGSGLAFRAGSQVFVLGSERRTYSTADPDFCHGARTADGREIPLTWIRSEWGLGVALWRASGEWPPDLAARLPRWEDLAPAGIAEGQAVHGPAGATGTALLAPSHRHGLPLGQQVLEVGHLRVGSADVGAPVTDDAGGWVGVIGPRYLQLIAGGSARAREWASDATPQDSPFVLSAGDIRQWLGAAPTSGSDPGQGALPVFRVLTADRLAGLTRVVAGQWLWNFHCPEGSPGTDSGPIGGPDGVGVGGPDGVGIGGDSAADPACEYAEPTALTADQAAQAPTRARPGGVTWDHVAQALAAGGRAQVPFFVGRREGQWQRLSFFDPSDFFTRLGQNGVQGVTLSDPPQQVPSALFALAQALRADAVAQFTQVSLAYFRLQVRYFYQIATLMESDQVDLIDRAEVESRIDPHGALVRDYWEQYGRWFGPSQEQEILEKWKQAVAALPPASPSL
jgi:hypothetical protein